MTSSEKTCAVLCIYLGVCLAAACCIPRTPQPSVNTTNDQCAAQGNHLRGCFWQRNGGKALDEMDCAFSLRINGFISRLLKGVWIPEHVIGSSHTPTQAQRPRDLWWVPFRIVPTCTENGWRRRQVIHLGNGIWKNLVSFGRCLSLLTSVWWLWCSNTREGRSYWYVLFPEI